MVREGYDVVVAGGGSAGIAAATAAARAGARTLLLERYGFLGGMATAGMVGTICGLYHGRSDGPLELLNGGLAAELADRLHRMPGTEAPLRRGRTYVLPYVPHELALVADELVAAERDLGLRLHATVVGVRPGERQRWEIEVAGWEGRRTVGADVLVDTSGDAVAALAAGAATETPEAGARQLCALVFVLQGAAEGALRGSASVAALRRVAAAEAAGELPAGSANVSWRPTVRRGEIVGKLALGELPAVDGDDWLTVAERTGRRRVAALVDLLRREVSGLAGVFVSHLAPQVGVRESRRVVGRYRLTREDVLGAARFPDAVARAAWPIELWRDGERGADYEYAPDGSWYEIPLRVLQPSGVERLLVAGRCISGTSEALGSARVIGTCLATGEAAGRVAASWGAS